MSWHQDIRIFGLFIVLLCISLDDCVGQQRHDDSHERQLGYRQTSASENAETSIAAYDPAKEPQLGKFVESALLKCAQGLRLFAKVLSVGTKTVLSVSRHVISEVSKSIWFDKASEVVELFKNGSARSLAVTSARSVVLATYTKTPHFVNSSRVLLDSVAQFSLEKAVEAIDVGSKHVHFLGKHAGTLLTELSLATERILQSEQTRKLGRGFRFHFQNLLVSSKQAGVLILNRALWSIAEYSHWVAPVVQEKTGEGDQLIIFSDANNLYTAVPVFTKGHQYLGTFPTAPSGGYMACAAACRAWTQRAQEACAVSRMRFGLGPRCTLCHSFVWYSPSHHSAILASKCFAISTPSWTLTYEINAFSGRFYSGHEDNHMVFRKQTPVSKEQNEDSRDTGSREATTELPIGSPEATAQHRASQQHNLSGEAAASSAALVEEDGGAVQSGMRQDPPRSTDAKENANNKSLAEAVLVDTSAIDATVPLEINETTETVSLAICNVSGTRGDAEGLSPSRADAGEVRAGVEGAHGSGEEAAGKRMAREAAAVVPGGNDSSKHGDAAGDRALPGGLASTQQIAAPETNQPVSALV